MTDPTSRLANGLPVVNTKNKKLLFYDFFNLKKHPGGVQNCQSLFCFIKVLKSDGVQKKTIRRMYGTWPSALLYVSTIGDPRVHYSFVCNTFESHMIRTHAPQKITTRKKKRGVRGGRVLWCATIKKNLFHCAGNRFEAEYGSGQWVV